MDQNYIVSSQSKGNFIFCFTGGQENYFGSIGWQNNNNPTFQGQHKLTNSTCVRPRRELREVINIRNKKGQTINALNSDIME